MESVASFKQGISKRGLLIIACIIWFVAGIILNQRGLIYILEFSRHILFHSIVGLGAGVFIFIIFFYSISTRYSRRIIRLRNENLPVYSFSYLKNFIIMGILIFFGLCLRRYGIADRLWLSIAYIAIGFSLIFGSFKFLFSYIRYNKLVSADPINKDH
jgi:hypothetical protein